MINAEISVTARHGQINLFQIRNDSHCRTGSQIVFEFIHRVSVAFGDDFYAAVRQVANRSQHLMPGRSAHGEKAVAYALNRAGNDESSGNHRKTLAQNRSKNLTAEMPQGKVGNRNNQKVNRKLSAAVVFVN